MDTRLKEMMKKMGVRQVDLARLARIDATRINRYVTGCAFPNEKTLARLARALGCKPSELQEVAQ